MTQEKLKILFVEDHKGLLENLAEFFSEQEYDPDFASDGLTALHLSASNTYDVIVLDIMLPGVDGMKILERIRKDLVSTVPILLLTALDSIEDKSKGFNLGADDYLTKPFDMRELELRIRALTKRSNTTSGLLTAGPLSYNTGTLSVTYSNQGQSVLSGLSASLFEALIRAYPNYVSYEDISTHLWGIEETSDHAIRTHIYMLRKTLKKSLGKSMIKALYGRGYQLDPEFD